MDAFENQDYQFDMLVEKLDLQRDLSRNPLFDTMFTLQNFADQRDDHQDSGLVSYDFSNKITKFDLSLTAIEGNEEIQFAIEYSTQLFKKYTIERMAKHFETIVTAIVENPEIKIADIEMISNEERLEILNEFNDTQVDYPKDKTLTKLFEEQVAKTADKVALVLDNEQMTYQELDQRSTYLAKLLRDKGISRNQIVGMLVEPSFEMVIGIFAILKAGGAYLPIDPAYPQERIKYILTDSKPKIDVNSRSTFLDKFNLTVELIAVDKQDLSGYNQTNLNIESNSTDLAYVIYTSGSTGKPKGVMIEHQGIANLKNSWKDDFAITQNDRIIQFASCAFDASVSEIYMALLLGATLYVISNDIINDYRKFESYLNENAITTVTLHPVYLNHLSLENILSLKRVITAGSATNYDLVNRWRGNVDYINAYGPTETTICATVWKAMKDGMIQKNIPIGMPISNTKAYILDKNLKPVPIGVIGELCIAGEGLARGYLNRPDLTAERFVENEFIGERIYRTGDLARRLVDGNIEFIGRMDNQVKIRGYRIEPGEIEQKLLEHANIFETVVLDQKDKDDNKDLVVYFVAYNELSIAELKTYLSRELPEYMIPSYFVQLDQMPLTPNGKVDTKALIELEKVQTKEYVAPSNETEEKLVTIWLEILGIEKVGLTDNFFEIGGHSLRATSLITEIYKAFRVELPLRVIFRTPTIRELAGYIQNAEELSYLKDENLVLLKRGTDDLNLFLVHGGDGEVEGYLDFAERQNPEFNCWGIRADRLKDYAPR